MAKERFLIVAIPMIPECFNRFSETDNRERIDSGETSSDPYSWIEATFELRLIRECEATHICSLTPSAWSIWLENVFVGVPNAAWERDPDPDCLEHESGGDRGDYVTFHDSYDKRFIAGSFTVDSVKDIGMRKPSKHNADALDAYRDAIWSHAEEIAPGYTIGAPVCDVFTYRQWERELVQNQRELSLQASKRPDAFNLHALSA